MTTDPLILPPDEYKIVRRIHALFDSDICRPPRHQPKCCGYTMRWVTQRQLDEEAANEG